MPPHLPAPHLVPDPRTASCTRPHASDPPHHTFFPTLLSFLLSRSPKAPTTRPATLTDHVPSSGRRRSRRSGVPSPTWRMCGGVCPRGSSGQRCSLLRPSPLTLRAASRCSLSSTPGLPPIVSCRQGGWSCPRPGIAVLLYFVFFDFPPPSGLICASSLPSPSCRCSRAPLAPHGLAPRDAAICSTFNPLGPSPRPPYAASVSHPHLVYVQLVPRSTLRHPRAICPTAQGLHRRFRPPTPSPLLSGLPPSRRFLGH